MIYKLICKRIFVVYFTFYQPDCLRPSFFFILGKFELPGGRPTRTFSWFLIFGKRTGLLTTSIWEIYSTLIIWLFEQIFLRRKRIYKCHYRFKDSNFQKIGILIFCFKNLCLWNRFETLFFYFKRELFWYFSKKIFKALRFSYVYQIQYFISYMQDISKFDHFWPSRMIGVGPQPLELCQRMTSLDLSWRLKLSYSFIW